MWRLVGENDERLAQQALFTHICIGPQNKTDVQLGLAAAIIANSSAFPATRAFNILCQTSSDAIKPLVDSIFVHLIQTKWTLLVDAARAQILWVFRELVRLAVSSGAGQSAEKLVSSVTNTGSDVLFFALSRQVLPGDVSPRNLFVHESLLDVLLAHREFIYSIPFMLATAVYFYLRAIQDHVHQQFEALRSKEISFCVAALRERVFIIFDYSVCSMKPRTALT